MFAHLLPIRAKSTSRRTHQRFPLLIARTKRNLKRQVSPCTTPRSTAAQGLGEPIATAAPLVQQHRGCNIPKSFEEHARRISYLVYPFEMPRTVTETITKGLAIDPPGQTPFSFKSNKNNGGSSGGQQYNMPGSGPTAGDGFSSGIIYVAAPAFTSTLTFLLTGIAVFLGTAAVSYGLLLTWSHVQRIYSGKKDKEEKFSVAEMKATALAAARTVTLSFVLTVLVLVLRTRQALASLAPIAYEVFTLVLGMETGVAAIVGGVWVLVRGLEKGM